MARGRGGGGARAAIPFDDISQGDDSNTQRVFDPYNTGVYKGVKVSGDEECAEVGVVWVGCGGWGALVIQVTGDCLFSLSEMIDCNYHAYALTLLEQTISLSKGREVEFKKKRTVPTTMPVGIAASTGGEEGKEGGGLQDASRGSGNSVQRGNARKFRRKSSGDDD